MLRIYNTDTIVSVEIFFNTKNEVTKIYFHRKADKAIIIINGDKSKYFEHIELTILNILNDKPFFSITKLEQAVLDRIAQLEKKDDEFENRV